MRRYRTEIVIPPDRYVGLQLPTHLPEGRAIVTILVDEWVSDAETDPSDNDPESQDIEWWDEFADPECEEPSELPLRSGLR
ncbi:MAG TPA: hypothetical protein VGZ22_23055 [Isosphaeraceae bacterium]|nr:hypothetical protein [Isosphaeraceae bacterium]